MAKPAVFSGKGLLAAKGGQQVEDWFRQVQHFVHALRFPQHEAVSVAVSLLSDEAARAWANHVRERLSGDVDRAVLADVKTAMLLRFAPAATTHTSRMTLDNMVLGKGGLRALAAHVSEFDRVCALIPDLGEAEKKHRFVASISKNHAHLVRVCCQDPLTSALFETYERMRTAALNAAAHSAEFVGGVGIAQEELAKRDSGRGGWKHTGQKRSNSETEPAAGAAGPSKRPGSGSGSGSQSGSGQRGKRPHRDALIYDYCKTKGVCMRCFQGGHITEDCDPSNPVAPAGTRPPKMPNGWVVKEKFSKTK
jgi:hypothetical protein